MVRHVDHRHTFCLEPLQVGQNFAFPRLIKGGKRLIEQQKSRLGNQRAPYRDPLLLTPGERAGAAREKLPDPEKIDDLFLVGLVASQAPHPAPKHKVLAHAEVWKQASLLEHIADPATMDGN